MASLDDQGDLLQAGRDALARFDSRQLRMFLAIVRERSFTAAADKLNMTQPALSRSLKLLEDRLGAAWSSARRKASA